MAKSKRTKAAAEPLLELEAELHAADKAWDAAIKAIENAEGKIGLKNCPRWGLVVLQTSDGECWWGRDEIIAAAKSRGYSHITKAERDLALAELDRLEREGRIKAKELGLAPLHEARDEGERRYYAALKQIAKTPAKTVAGLAVKVRILARNIEISDDDPGGMAKSATKDAERLTRRAA